MILAETHKLSVIGVAFLFTSPQQMSPLTLQKLCFLYNSTTSSYLIPKQPEKGCPENTFGCSGGDCNIPTTCFCEQHCSWEVCRIVDYPEDCLDIVKSVWKWDSKKHSWVAQVEGKNMNIVFD